MRGEQLKITLDDDARIGSSPRARGTALGADGLILDVRFIPACAGNSHPQARMGRCSPVHPRVRGEQPRHAVCAMAANGSSPRARGTVGDCLWRAGRGRFIPACAGNSRRSRGRLRSASVHPRVRGEQLPLKTISTDQDGSSPRARGTGQQLGRAQAFGRFIPACAGNRPARTPATSARTVHPRVRGEQASTESGSLASSGSSPRARGTAEADAIEDAMARFIPACAGNRPSCGKQPSRKPVHPRVRGEQLAQKFAEAGYNGSSPRARGTVVVQP